MNPRACALIIVAVVAVCAVAAGVFPSAHAGEDKNPVVKEISLAGIKLDMDGVGPLKKPAVLTSVEELTKALAADKETVGQIAKQVDFMKQQLIYFRWAGSGQDKIKPVVQMGTTGAVVIFEYTPGLTRDYVQHAKLFAIAKGAKWEMKTKPFKGE